MKDVRGTKLKVSDRVRIEEDIPSVDGMLYKDTIVVVKGLGYPDRDIKVVDDLGKIYYLNFDNIAVKL